MVGEAMGIGVVFLDAQVRLMVEGYRVAEVRSSLFLHAGVYASINVSTDRDTGKVTHRGANRKERRHGTAVWR
jgi:hypothetical protein